MPLRSAPALWAGLLSATAYLPMVLLCILLGIRADATIQVNTSQEMSDALRNASVTHIAIAQNISVVDLQPLLVDRNLVRGWMAGVGLVH